LQHNYYRIHCTGIHLYPVHCGWFKCLFNFYSNMWIHDRNSRRTLGSNDFLITDALMSAYLANNTVRCSTAVFFRVPVVLFYTHIYYYKSSDKKPNSHVQFSSKSFYESIGVFHNFKCYKQNILFNSITTIFLPFKINVFEFNEYIGKYITAPIRTIWCVILLTSII